MTDALWYLARGSGAVSLVLLTAVVILGIANRAGGRFAGLNRLAVASVHRSVALLAVAFLTIHVVTLMFDPYAGLNLLDVVIPFGSAYRTFFVALGTIALDLMIALVATSLLRDRIGRRAWRAVHWFAYAMWPVALLHGIGSGTDRSTPWLIGIEIACVLAVLGVGATLHPALAGERNPKRDPEPTPARTPALVGAGARRDNR